MVLETFRMVCLGRKDRRDLASLALQESMLLGAETEFLIDQSKEDFNQGEIDWRDSLDSANWLILNSSSTLEGDRMKWAWGASMTFGELEGCKTAMLVVVPEDSSRMEEAWGSIIDRIRQVHFLYLSREAVEAVAKLECVESSSLIVDVRDKGLVPLVCSFDPLERAVNIAHSFGESRIQIGEEISPERWIAGFLCGLSASGSGEGGIEDAAMSIPPNNDFNRNSN